MARDRLSTKKKINQQLIRKLQDRIAELAVGISTLRNQGAKGVARRARRLLKTIRLDQYNKCQNQQEFSEELNSDTDDVRKGLPRGARHWGTARKALNIFLRDVVYDGCLCEHFRLAGIVGWLELPLDSYSMDGLRGEKEGGGLPKHSPIKRMDESLSAKFQGVAREVANRMGTQPVHLDLLYFRNGKRKSQKRLRNRARRKRASHQ